MSRMETCHMGERWGAWCAGRDRGCGEMQVALATRGAAHNALQLQWPRPPRSCNMASSVLLRRSASKGSCRCGSGYRATMPLW